MNKGERVFNFVVALIMASAVLWTLFDIITTLLF